jgi:outer membrane cobalamin receptor
MLSEHLAARLSVSIVTGRQDFEVLPGDPMNRSIFIDENRDQSVAAARVEYRNGKRSLVTDLWTQQSAFAVPPSNITSMNSNSYTVVDGETQGRLGVAYDDEFQDLKIQGRGFFHLLTRKTSYYNDATLATRTNIEDLDATRSGAGLLANRELGKRWHLIASANLESDSGDAKNLTSETAKGRATTAQSAVAAQYEQDNFDMQTAVGVAVPIGLGAAPWPEFKAAFRYTPTAPLELKAVSGYKGRTPTLRERHNLNNGNTELGPEKVLFGELGIKVTPSSYLQGSAAAYLRKSNGLIINDSSGGMSRYVNTGDLTIRGLDTLLEGKLNNYVSGGGSWNYTEAEDASGASKPLDFLPKHRFSTWLRGTAGDGGATLRVQYTGTQIDKQTELGRRVLVQASAFYRFLDTYQVTVRAENVGGFEYEQRELVPGPGRQVYASVQSEWE